MRYRGVSLPLSREGLCDLPCDVEVLLGQILVVGVVEGVQLNTCFIGGYVAECM